MLLGLLTKPEQKVPALSGHLAAEGVWCTHDTLPIFVRAAVSQEADSCPLGQGGSAETGDGPFCQRLLIAVSVSYQGRGRACSTVASSLRLNSAPSVSAHP